MCLLAVPDGLEAVEHLLCGWGVHAVDEAAVGQEQRRVGVARRHRVVVGLSDSSVVGYACSSRWRPKPAYETSVETSIYLSPDATGLGVGTRLYAALFESLREQDIHRAFAGIALPNPASVALHERFGFKRVALFTEQGRKFDRYWDVAWYEKAFGAT